MGIPDIRFINRKIPIADVARALGLRISSDGNIHCWRPSLHQHGDQTASVGIRKTNNTVKCFGCGIGPLSVIDFVMAILDLKEPGEVARWVAARFDVPEIQRGRHIVEPERRRFHFGHESEIGLLVYSGLWARLSPAARAIVPVLLEFAEQEPGKQTQSVTISYRALMRYSGVGSPNAISAALRELEKIQWISVLAGGREPGSGPVRATSTYLLTPRSDELMELANANYEQMRDEIATQRALQAEARAKRKSVLLTK
jgi:hypothetical protein